jgi:hypothetical protein
MGTLIVCWVVLPLLFGAVATGWGWIAQRVGALELPGALLPLLGFASITVIAAAATAADATAELAFPIVVAGGFGGLAWLWRAGRIKIDPWKLAAPLVVFAVYAAPIVASGEATFAGYLKLDDDSTWFALTDRMLEHGRNLEGLAASTYQLTLAFNLGDWYPVGVFPPLGIAAKLVHEDVAWVIQPYMALLAALLTLAFAAIARPLVGSARRAALIAVIAAQPSLLIGYYLWGGLKEMASAPLVVLAAVLAADAASRRAGPRQLIPLAVTAAALVSILTLGGAVWIAPVVIGAVVVAIRDRWSPALVLRAGALLVAIVAALSVPLLINGGVLPPTSSDLDNLAQLGNLAGPLNYLQAFGIWPAGDFRYDSAAPAFTYPAIAVAIAAAGYGIWRAWERGEWPVVFLALVATVGTATIVSFGSPWVDAKALAVASPALLFLAAFGAAGLIQAGRRLEGWGALALIGVGVVWSSALAYHDVNLAPRAQLHELEQIGDQIGGEGPTLITEYQPYGARHFLRDADPESASELRLREVRLRSGRILRTGGFADTDELRLGGLLKYRTLVVRRSPAQSRPPAAYRLIREGRYYEVWQWLTAPTPPLAHLPLGERVDRTAPGTGTDSSSVPSCAEVLALADRVGPGGRLVAAPGRPTTVIKLPRGPEGWKPSDETPGSLVPTGSAVLRAGFELQRATNVPVWVRGSTRGRLAVSIDSRPVGSVRHRINFFGQYIEFGSLPLAAGRHEIELDYGGPDLHPGSGGPPFELTPIVLGTAAGDAGDLVRVPAARAGSLCGKRWDWIEAQR